MTGGDFLTITSTDCSMAPAKFVARNVKVVLFCTLKVCKPVTGTVLGAGDRNSTFSALLTSQAMTTELPASTWPGVAVKTLITGLAPAGQNGTLGAYVGQKVT